MERVCLLKTDVVVIWWLTYNIYRIIETGNEFHTLPVFSYYKSDKVIS